MKPRNLRSKINVDGEKSRSKNFDMEAFHEFTNNQHYFKCFKVLTQAGSVNLTNEIDFGGDARFLKGFMIYSDDPNDIFSLKINREQVIENMGCVLIQGPLNNQGMRDYRVLPRLLSGSDTVELKIDSLGSHNFYIGFALVSKIPDQA